MAIPYIIDPETGKLFDPSIPTKMALSANKRQVPFDTGRNITNAMADLWDASKLAGLAPEFAPIGGAPNIPIATKMAGQAIGQGANASRQGQFLSDLRFDTARKAAVAKGMPMANAPVTKTQGVWVDPASNVEEFNRVYAQNVGRLPKAPIQENTALTQYAQSMGGDLGQWGVGAARFSPLPFNINKNAANAVMYPKASAQNIIDAGKKLNPKGGVVSATPQGGMIVFDTSGSMTAKDLAGSLKGVSSKPKYGLLDSAYFDTSAQPQGAYMMNVDDLIKGLGY